MKRGLTAVMATLTVGACSDPEVAEGHSTSPRVSIDQARLSLDGTDYYGRISINITSIGSDRDSLLFVQALEPIGGLDAEGTGLADIDDMLQLVLDSEAVAAQATAGGVSIAPTDDATMGTASGHSITRRDTSSGRSTWERFALVGGNLEISSAGSLSGALLVQRTGDFDYAVGAWTRIDGAPTLPIEFSGDDTTVYCFEGETVFELAPGATLPCTAVKKTREEPCGDSAPTPSEGTSPADPGPGSLQLPGCE